MHQITTCAIFTTFHNIEHKYNTQQPSNCNLRKQPFSANKKKSISPRDSQIQHKIFKNNAYSDLRSPGDNIHHIMQLLLTQMFHISIIDGALNFFNNRYKNWHVYYHFYVFRCMHLHYLIHFWYNKFWFGTCGQECL